MVLGQGAVGLCTRLDLAFESVDSAAKGAGGCCVGGTVLVRPCPRSMGEQDLLHWEGWVQIARQSLCDRGFACEVDCR